MSLTLVSGDKPEEKRLTEAEIQETEELANDFAKSMLDRGFHAMVILGGKHRHVDHEHGVPGIEIGILEGSSDATCDAILQMLFNSIESMVELNPSLKLDLRMVKNNIFKSISAGKGK